MNVPRLMVSIALLASATMVREIAAQDTADHVDAYLAGQVETEGIPGLTAAVVRGGEVLYLGAFGVRSLDGDERLTPHHVFHFASVSKPFVATAIVQLAEQGRLTLDDRVTDHLPYFRLADDRYRSITIRQMLNHTAGMVDVGDYEWDSPQYDEGAAERFVREMASDGMLWAPGGGWRYSNKAFDALGDLIAKVSGMSFEEYMRTHILDPIGMDGTSFIHGDIDEKLRTTGHVGSPARVSEVYPYNRRHAPSSTLNSSVAQMVNWMLVNLGQGELNGRRILRPESYDLLWGPSADTGSEGVSVGLSWFLSERDGHRIVGHGGGDTGFRSYILLMPDDGIGVVIASNWSATDTNALATELARLALTEMTGATSAATGEPAGPAAEVRAREIAFAKTMADRDLEAFLSFISPEAIFFAGNEPMRGRDAIERGWAPFFEGEAAPFSWHPDVVEVLDSGRLALSSGPVLGPTGEEGGRFNSIWRKDADGEWRVIFDKGS